MLRTNIFLLLAKSFHRAMRQRQLKCRELDVVAGLPKITVHVHERMWDTGISLEDNFVSVGQEFAGISLALVSHGITASGDDDGFWQVGEAGGLENVLEPAHLGHFLFSLRLILGKSVPLELVKYLMRAQFNVGANSNSLTEPKGESCAVSQLSTSATCGVPAKQRTSGIFASRARCDTIKAMFPPTETPPIEMDSLLNFKAALFSCTYFNAQKQSLM